MSSKPLKKGKVYLIGAGPGDPGLITVRGLELLRRCDVIVTDRLANPLFLEHLGYGAEVIYAGKASNDHTLTQEEINAVLINRAKQGHRVARLKGGDPFVFGRGGEEAIALAEAGIEFEVVPGVSSSVAAAAYAGIPVTHRKIASSFAVITGHEAPDKADSDIKWDKISTGADTLVFLMGIESLSNIVENLTANGRSSHTPVAVIEWGTLAKQKTVVGKLDDILKKCKEANIQPPAVAVVGDVVNLRETISWFEEKPLFGKRILVTRPKHQAWELAEALSDLGADVVEIPVIEIKCLPDGYAAIDSVLDNAGDYDWIIFTSGNGVTHFLSRIIMLSKDIRILGKTKLAAIGSETASFFRAFHLVPDYVPSKYVAEEFINQFPEDVKGKSILIPRALEARETIPDELRARGADVTVIPVYQTKTNYSRAEDLKAQLSAGNLDIITFTSSSTVKAFVELAGNLELPKYVKIACIGPITAQTARENGLEPSIIADEYTADGLVKALITEARK